MISIVIVNWNSGPLLEKCVRSLQMYAPECEIVVVDNASADSSTSFADQIHWHGLVLNNEENRGYAAANNQGWHRSAGDPVLFLNPDIECHEGSVLRMAATLAEGDRTWAVGGKLVDPSGRPQAKFNVRPFPTVSTVRSEMLLFDRLRSGRSGAAAGVGTPVEVDQPAGASLMVRREILERLRGFDEAFYPAWFEDVDFCMRVYKEGGRILFEPRAQFLHHGGSSLSALGREAFLRHYYGNQLRYFRKHHGPDSEQRVRKLIVAGLNLRALLAWIHAPSQEMSRGESARVFRQAAQHFSRHAKPTV